jgi:hypothetical protein
MTSDESMSDKCPVHSARLEYEELRGYPGKTLRFCPECRKEQSRSIQALCCGIAPDWEPAESQMEAQERIAREVRRSAVAPALARCIEECWETLTVFDGTNERRVRELLRNAIESLVEKAIL